MNEPLTKYASYVPDGWVIAIASAVVMVALAAVLAAQSIVRGDDPDRPGVAQHVARLGAAAALIAGAGTALWASRAIERIGAENSEHFEKAQKLLREAGVTTDDLDSPSNLMGASSSLETVGDLPSLIGWTLMFMVIGRVFVTNGIRPGNGLVSPRVP